MHVWHVIDAAAPWGGPCTQRVAADVVASLHHSDAGSRHEVLIIGSLHDAQLAQTCGLRPFGAIAPRGRRAVQARAALERLLAVARARGAAPDVLHAWTAAAGMLVCGAARDVPSVVTPRPLAIDADSPHLRLRTDIRARWARDEGIARDEFVLGLIGEPVDRFDARQAMHVGARTGLSSRRIRMIMSGRALGRPEAQRFLARLDLDHVIVQDEAVERPWEILRGLDAVLLLGASHSRAASSVSALPALWAFAAGVPVIAEARSPAAALVAHGETALVFPEGDLNSACDRLARLHDDQELAARLILQARRRISEHHDLRTLIARVRESLHRARDRGRDEYVQVAPDP